MSPPFFCKKGFIKDMSESVVNILEGVRDGTYSVEEATLKLKEAPFADIDFAKIDLHRKMRQGVAEVIYGAGKTAQQISGIIDAMVQNGQESILITRISEDEYKKIESKSEVTYHPEARIATVGGMPEPDGIGKIVVVTAGTSDIPVAEEAAVTAEFLGNRVERIYDVGVAGLHRLMARLDDIMSATVIIAIAGMEGALSSVIGGLADCPVIAVPTSVGYGASFEGLTALLAMLNSCASTVSVVNIDNGFGAAYVANKINHILTHRRDNE